MLRIHRMVSAAAQVLCLTVTLHAADFAAPASLPRFDDVRRSWFDAGPAGETANPSSGGQLVDLTNMPEAATPRLTDGAEWCDVALVRGGRLLGLIAPSDRAFYCFVSPQSNPLFMEDPRTLTEVRFHFVNQWIPDSNPVFGGGTAQFAAAQVRLALTQRLSIVASKDGYIWLNPNNDALSNDGFADIGAGLKYNLIRDPARQFLLSSGFVYNMPSGAQRVFQGNGDGEWHLFLSAGKEFFQRAHWISGAGLRLPNDPSAQSKMFYWSNAFDVRLTGRLYGLMQVNWFHWYQSGNALAANFEGNDLFNLGSNNVAGNDIVTGSIGARYKFGRYHEAGVGYEIPLSNRDDLLESRLFADVILRY